MFSDLRCFHEAYYPSLARPILTPASGFFALASVAVRWIAPESGKVSRESGGRIYGCAIRGAEGGETPGGLYYNGEFSSPWSVSSPHSRMGAPHPAPGAGHVIIYHLLTEGKALAPKWGTNQKPHSTGLSNAGLKRLLRVSAVSRGLLRRGCPASETQAKSRSGMASDETAGNCCGYG